MLNYLLRTSLSASIIRLSKYVINSRPKAIFQQNCPPSLMSKAKKLKMSTDSASSEDDKRERIIWVDLEMTGLDVKKERIIEMACLVTDQNLNIIAEGPDLVIKTEDAILDAMDEWCTKHHGESGLTQSVRESKISVESAEKTMVEFVCEHTMPGKCPLGGNSVYVDKLFLAEYMPTFTKHLHYRIVDVSSIKEICRRWYPKEYYKAPTKKNSHRALDDIKESIEELKYYRQSIFK